MMNQSTLYVFLGISGFVLMFVALFYPRKKEKEEQAKSDLATLLEQLDWPGVRRFIFKELRGWIALTVLATAFLIVCIVKNYRVIFAVSIVAVFYYRLYKYIRLLMLVKLNMQKTADYRDVTAHSETMLNDFTTFIDCPYTILSAKTAGEEIMKTYMQCLERGRKEGFWPLLIYVRQENLEAMLTQMKAANGDIERVRTYRNEMMNYPLPDAKVLFNQWLNECINVNKHMGKDWLKELMGEPTEVELSTTFLIDDTFEGRLLLCEVPVKEPWQLLAWCPMDIVSPAISATQNMAVAKYLYEHYKVIPAFLDYQLIDFLPQEPIPDDEIEPLALNLFSYCPDWIYQDFFNLANGKQMIKDAKVWTMLWSVEPIEPYGNST